MSHGWGRVQILLLAGVCIFGSNVRSEVELGIEANSFFKESAERAVNQYTFNLGYKGETKQELFDAKYDIKTFVFVDDFSTITPEIFETYIETPDSFSKNQKWTFGRKKFSWSVGDQFWRQGVWEPRFAWDPVDPVTVGHLGLFYEYKHSWGSVTAMSTPLHVPDRGYPISVNNNLLEGASAFWNPLPQEIQLSTGEPASINYKLETPAIEDLIIKPTIALQSFVGKERGLWASASYGYLPIPSTDLVATPVLISKDFVVEATIRPRVLMHHLATLEGGIRQKRWSIWASMTREEVETQFTESDDLFNPIGPAWIGSMGTEINWAPQHSISMGYIFVREDLSNAQVSDNDSIGLSIPDRFRLRDGLEIRAAFNRRSQNRFSVAYTNDIRNINSMLGFKFEHLGSFYRFYAAADLFFNQNDQGWIGQFIDNERIKGGVSFVF